MSGKYCLKAIDNIELAFFLMNITKSVKKVASFLLCIPCFFIKGNYFKSAYIDLYGFETSKRRKRAEVHSLSIEQPIRGFKVYKQ
jgi:hypothetical protein